MQSQIYPNQFYIHTITFSFAPPPKKSPHFPSKKATAKNKRLHLMLL